MAGLGFNEEERMALLDSGASHPFRERALREDDGVPVRVGVGWREIGDSPAEQGGHAHAHCGL